MKIAIMQPYLFPYIGYFQLMNSVDKFVVYDDVHFINKGWINRNAVLVNGSRFEFTLPLAKAGQNRIISDIEVIRDDRWMRKFVGTLKTSYKNAPFLEPTMKFIYEILDAEERTISELVVRSLRSLVAELGIDCQLVETSSVYGNAELSGVDRILDICLREGAAEYVNPIGGRQLYDPARFSANGIKLSFLHTDVLEYHQSGGAFVPNLSIIDVLMFNGIEGTRKLLGKCKLVEA